MKECPACEAAREAMIKSLRTAIDALEDPVLGHEIIEQRGTELACVISDVVEIVADVAAGRVESVGSEEGAATVSGDEYARAGVEDEVDPDFFDAKPVLAS